jgi:hypothetical protein
VYDFVLIITMFRYNFGWRSKDWRKHTSWVFGWVRSKCFEFDVRTAVFGNWVVHWRTLADCADFFYKIEIRSLRSTLYALKSIEVWFIYRTIINFWISGKITLIIIVVLIYRETSMYKVRTVQIGLTYTNSLSIAFMSVYIELLTSWATDASPFIIIIISAWMAWLAVQSYVVKKFRARRARNSWIKLGPCLGKSNHSINSIGIVDSPVKVCQIRVEVWLGKAFE